MPSLDSRCLNRTAANFSRRGSAVVKPEELSEQFTTLDVDGLPPSL